VTLGSVSDQKQWIDAVDPLTACFHVYSDFYVLGNGVYHKTSDTFEGDHCVVVVGYNDSLGAWLVRNSWGTTWGMNGYGWIGYGEVNIDGWAKYGVHVTNPDPWTKRRLHSGNIIESGNGSVHRNFEMQANGPSGKITHYWREGADLSWHTASVLGNDAAVCPTLTSTTYNRNFESVHLTTTRRLHHWFFDQVAGRWTDGGIFGPTDAAGVPGFIQSDYGAPGNLEVVVKTGDGRLNHWWRLNGPPWTWSDGGRFAANVALSGPALVQRRNRGLDVVCVLNDGTMQLWSRDDARGFVWSLGQTFGAGISSPPCMIEGQFGAADETVTGNYELCVAAGGQVQHWWRDNNGGSGWHMSAQFGHDIQAVAGLVEGSYGFDLEMIALRRDGALQHYWRDGAGWHEGVVIGTTVGAMVAAAATGAYSAGSSTDGGSYYSNGGSVPVGVVYAPDNGPSGPVVPDPFHLAPLPGSKG
jgi:hypothetical protein